MAHQANGTHPVQTSFTLSQQGVVTYSPPKRRSPAKLTAQKVQAAVSKFQMPAVLSLARSSFLDSTAIQFSPDTGLPIPDPGAFSAAMQATATVSQSLSPFSSPGTPSKSMKRKKPSADTSQPNVTPERPPNQSVSFQATPSPITPSRVASIAKGHTPKKRIILKEPCDYHDLDKLLTTVKNKNMKFKGKKEHTVSKESPTKRIKPAVLTQSDARDYFLKVSSALEADSTQKFPPLQVSPQTQVRVQTPRVATIKHATGVQRDYGMHERPDGTMASLFPKAKGHNTFSFKKGAPDVPSPGKIRDIVKNYRSSPPATDASEFFEREYEQLTPPSSSLIN